MTQSKTILVVDDVEMFRDLAVLFLVRTARVIQAASGEEALEILARESIDLMLADLHMPGMDGAMLCRAAKQMPGYELLPVIMMLRDSSHEDGVKAVRAGANDMLCKPLSRGALIECVRHFLEDGLSRALPRIEIVAPVQLRNSILHTWGTALNISRGGLSVEADCELEPKSEVAVQLMLPETQIQIEPMAEVIWSRDTRDQRMIEMGLRFLSMGSDAMRTLEDFIAQRTLTARGFGAAQPG
ncbi:MAG: response regulator [Deltaproteobacteria bacterium]|jgi:CheY-like chemotaxis protein|nr:response regulator [Deltaproteobacteria bacterium]MBW2384297.1 response regulator [Deltaproteobacteria bacterium]